MASKEAIAIRDAHEIYKKAIGTPFEIAARRNLESVVRSARPERSLWSRMSSWVRWGT